MALPFFRSCTFCIILSGGLLFSFENDQDRYIDQLADKAQELYKAALYSQAIPIYQQILQTLASDIEKDQGSSLKAKQIRLKLAQSYYYLDNYKEVIKTLSISPDEEDAEPYQNGLYLSALAYRKLGQHERAIQELNAYLRGEKQQLPFYDEVQIELGLNYFQLGKLKEAQAFFKSISPGIQNMQLYFLSRFYLIRIGLLQGDKEDVDGILNDLSSQIPTDDPLQYELAYLHGEALFQREDYANAVGYFIQALPKNNSEACPWYAETLYHQGWSYLKIGEDPLKSSDAQNHYFQKAAEAFQALLKHSPEERVYLALGQCYLTRARCLKEENAYMQAEDLLSKQEVFLSREAQAHALLLRAEAAPSYSVRDKFYRQLTQEANSESSFYGKGWYLRGLNDFEEGQSLLANKENLEAKKAFERAAVAFKKGFEHLKGCLNSHDSADSSFLGLCKYPFKTTEKTRAALALKYQAQAHEHQNTHEGRLAAFSILEGLFNQYPEMLLSMDHPDEIFYLHGYVASLLVHDEGGERFAEIAEHSLQEGINRYPRGAFTDASLNLLAALQYRKGEYKQAEETYLHLASEYPMSPYAGEAWFWAASCSEKLGSDLVESKKRRRNVFENYPESVFSAEAYFTYYTYRDYLQGDRVAIKHLQGLATEHPDSPFLIQAHYLIALDYKRDRKSPEGKWIRKKNLTAAIDAFQDAETVHDSLSEKELIPEELRHYYLMIRYRATLERALANLAIADESQGAKRQIYLEYAEEVFRQLVDDFENPEHPLAKQLMQGDSYPQIQEESSFWLAQTYIKAHNDEAAEKIFSKMLDRYRTAKITKGYFLSRVWYEQGMIALRRKEYALALQCFKHAEEAAKGRVLNTDQKLDLWIQQSCCYKGLNQWDNAILILSKVINDDAISGLRLKAMYLRAEIYELQERRELARKQLQTTAKKGGEWALKAKEKLEKDYGY